MTRYAYFILLILTFAGNVFSQNLTDTRSITVYGDATIYAVPDEIIISMGIEERNLDLSAARSTTDRAVATVLDYCASLGIEKKYVQTDNISIQPQYSYANQDMYLNGYIVRKTITVTLKDIEGYDAFISGALDRGINTIQNVQFRTTELRKHRDRARELAIIAAKEKATAMATTAGVSIGHVISIQEQSPQTYGWFNSRYAGGMAQNVMQDAGGATSDMQTLSPGQIAVDARVTLVYALK